MLFKEIVDGRTDREDDDGRWVINIVPLEWANDEQENLWSDSVDSP